MLKASNEFIQREIAGEFILVPTGQMALQVKGMISLSPSGAFLWQLLQQETTQDQLVQAMLKEYDIDDKTATADVAEFVQQMRTVGVLVQGA